jgi:hypothetical protein
MIENGKPANGSPLQRLVAAVGDANSGAAKVLAGDVLDLCGFVGDEKAFGKLAEQANAAIEKEARSGAGLTIKVDVARSLIEAAFAKK